ncbi:MAG: hypothetical protein ACI4CS_04735 [Candidatus Weimeria sp.]
MGRKRSQVKWSDKEIAFLKDNWGSMGGEVCTGLTAHSTAAVRQKAKELGLKRTTGKNSYWNDKETEFLIENASSLSAKEIAEELKRPKSSVFWKLNSYGMHKRKDQA